MLTISCLLLAALYVLLMTAYYTGWKLQPAFHLAEDDLPVTTITVVIPARNEADHIEACIASILAQDYPAGLAEIIVVDDHSEDDTAVRAAAMGNRVRVLFMKDILDDGEPVFSYKKKALAAGISQSAADLIVTTDADCIAPPQWLRHIAAMYERRQSAMIIGPVAFTNSGSLVERFQSLDFMMMQGITAAAHRLKLGGMANGANLAFSREAFYAIDGYAGIDHLASGDDYLLLYKMAQHFPDCIHYLKSSGAVVRTAPQPTWGAFLQQRIRWASKSGKYPDLRLTAILLLVYVFNVVLAGAAVAALLMPRLWWLVAAMLAVKVVAEIIFLYPVAGFFRKRNELLIFPLLQPLHVLYIVLAGFLGMTGSYRWKGRRIR